MLLQLSCTPPKEPPKGYARATVIVSKTSQLLLKSKLHSHSIISLKVFVGKYLSYTLNDTLDYKKNSYNNTTAITSGIIISLLISATLITIAFITFCLVYKSKMKLKIYSLKTTHLSTNSDRYTLSIWPFRVEIIALYMTSVCCHYHYSYDHLFTLSQLSQDICSQFGCKSIICMMHNPLDLIA